MKNCLVMLLLMLSWISLCAQEHSIQVVSYEGEEYFLYPEKQRINFNPTTLIWKIEVTVSKEELRKYKWHERRFFRKKLVATKFPVDGNWIQLYEIDTLQAAKIFEVRNGLPNGVLKRFNEYGQLVEMGTYSNGNRNGVFHFYPDSTRYWREEHSTGEYKMSDSMYYEMAFLPYYHVIEIGKEGKWETRGRKGDLIRVENYSNGQLDGQQVEYHNNGMRAHEQRYVMGLREGVQKFWHKNGQLLEESIYHNNLREGRFFNWFEDGRPKCNLEYSQDSIINGKCTLYYPSGTLFGMGTLDDNVKVGDWTFWYEGGTKMAEGKYQGYTTDVCISGMARPYLYSVPVGRWNYWYENSNQLASGDYYAVKTRISRGEIYEAKIIEGSWTCRDLKGNIIPCAAVEEIMNLKIKN